MGIVHKGLGIVDESCIELATVNKAYKRQGIVYKGQALYMWLIKDWELYM